MKFLALRAALEGALTKPVEAVVPAVVPPSVREPVGFLPAKGEVQRVVDGVVRWEPIDRVAARIVQRASWLCRPPVSAASVPVAAPEKVRVKGKDMSHTDEMTRKLQAKVRSVVDPVTGETRYEVGTPEQNAEFRMAMVERNLVEMQRHAGEIVTALETSQASILEAFRQNGPAINERIAMLRSARMSVVAEISQMLTQLRDVRAFFFEEGHAREMERLEAFVSLCERLKELKADGTLDAVCDTALRLGVGLSRQ